MRTCSRTIAGLVMASLVCLSVAGAPDVRAEEKPGTLLIMGGAIKDSNTEVYQKLRELAGGDNGKIAVIPTASARPSKSTCEFFEKTYNIKTEYIDITESNYTRNAYSDEICAKIRSCTGVYFSGGDQGRIIRSFVETTGAPTPALKAIWDVYRNGGVISGSSAGAAVMSNPMFLDGSPQETLDWGVTDSLPGGWVTKKGFGFFEGGMVDQHFGARGRLGRLVVALSDLNIPYGFGVDENTAMVVTNRTAIQAIGQGGVFIVDMTGSKRLAVKKADGDQRKYFACEGIRISYIERGDSYDWQTKTFTIKPVRKPIADPYYENNCFTGDILSPDKVHRTMCELVDNATVTEANTLAIIPEKFESDRLVAHGYRFFFAVDGKTKGYYATIDQGESYAVINLLLIIYFVPQFTVPYQTSAATEMETIVA